MFRTPAWR